MAKTMQRQRVVGNPAKRAFGTKKRKAAAGHRRPRKTNPGQIVGFTLANPGRKAHMKKKQHHSKSHRPAGQKRKRRNPGTAVVHHRRRRNPSAFGSGGIGPSVTNAVFAIVGAIGSKLGAQAFLGTKNTGLFGYAGNAATGGVLWFVAEKVMKNREAAKGIITGTIIQIILRVLNDYTPFGSYVANLGMGDYQAQAFVTPQVLTAPMRNADIRIPAGWGAPPMSMLPAPAAAGMGSLYGSSRSGGGLYSV